MAAAASASASSRPCGRSSPGEPLELVHRLDRDTSGCLLVARDAATLRTLHALLREGQCDKRYLVLVAGKWDLGQKRIDVPLRTDTRVGGERTVRADASGKPSVSDFRPVQFFGKLATLMEVGLRTGRTHQIRVHATYAGHPVAGDEKYGDAEFNERMRELGLARMFLHAHIMSFDWPHQGGLFSASAPLPPSLRPCSIGWATTSRQPEPGAAQGGGQPDEWQADEGGRIAALDAVEERDAQALRPKASRAVERALPLHVALDLLAAQAAEETRSWCRCAPGGCPPCGAMTAHAVWKRALEPLAVAS